MQQKQNEQFNYEKLWLTNYWFSYQCLIDAFICYFDLAQCCICAALPWFSQACLSEFLKWFNRKQDEDYMCFAHRALFPGWRNKKHLIHCQTVRCTNDTARMALQKVWYISSLYTHVSKKYMKILSRSRRLFSILKISQLTLPSCLFVNQKTECSSRHKWQSNIPCGPYKTCLTHAKC